jgi:hypothetical protein
MHISSVVCRNLDVVRKFSVIISFILVIRFRLLFVFMHFQRVYNIIFGKFLSSANEL